MATKTFEGLKQMAIQIRDEKANKQNTAIRIGTQMLEHLNKLEQEYYNKENIDEQKKQTDVKFSELGYKLIKLYALSVPDEPLWNDFINKPIYNKDTKLIRVYDGEIWSTIPYIEGAIYQYDYELYVVDNNNNLINVVQKLKNEIQENNGGIWNDEYFLKTDVVGEAVPISPSINKQFTVIEINVQQNDEFYIKSKGGSYGRSWAFLNSNREVISNSQANEDVNDIIKAPQNSVKLVLNSYINEPHFIYNVKSLAAVLKNDIKSLKESIAELDNKFTDSNININNIDVLFQKTNNLAQITSMNGYLGADGNFVQNNGFDSALVLLEANETYFIHQTNTLNNIRIFKKEDNIFTQVEVLQGQDVEYTCPDVNNYYLQCVYDKLVSPITKDRWFSVTKGQKSTQYTPIKSLIENEVIKKELEEFKAKYSLRILAIGNSYSSDALSYLPFILEELFNIKVTIGILFYPGCTLQKHLELINNDTNYSAFNFYDTSLGKWSTQNNINFTQAIEKEKWDIIFLQQQSSNARDYSTYQPYLNEIITKIHSKLNYSVKLGWLLTMAYPDNYSGLNGDTSDQMFEKICNSVSQMMENTAIEFYVPIGTAIQNARKTVLNNLGNFGGLTYEGLHLQEGIPCLIESYVVALYLSNMFGYKGIFGKNIFPDQAWITEKNVIEQHGQAVGVNNGNIRIAQLCAMAAIKRPLEVSDMSFL